MARTPARTNPDTNVLDDLFGFRTITFGQASFTVRRMLTRKQRRSVQALQKDINRLVAEARAEDITDEQAETLEDQACEMLALGLRAVVITEAPWEEMDLVGLSTLFRQALLSLANAEDEELQTLGIPTSAG